MHYDQVLRRRWVLAEALWHKLHHQGVDALGLALGVTDTAALRRLLVQRGVLAGEDDPSARFPAR